MSLDLIVLHAGLATVAFLIVLNGYLRGASKTKIDVGLSVAHLGLLIVAFVSFGVWMGLVAFGASFVYGTLFQPLAKCLAHRMLGYRTALPEEEDTSVDDLIQGRVDVDEFLERSDQQEEKRRKRLERLGRQPEIREVLAKHGKTTEHLEGYLQLLRASGQGAVAWEYLSDPNDLDLIVRLDDEGRDGFQIVAKLME